jgi:hypothetical protein
MPARLFDSEPVESATVIPGEPPVIVLVVDDQHRDLVDVARRTSSGSPSSRFSGGWGGTSECDPEGVDVVSFEIDEPSRRWDIVDPSDELIDLAAIQRHWVALVPAAIAGTSRPDRTILQHALVIDIPERVEGFSTVRAQREWRANPS